MTRLRSDEGAWIVYVGLSESLQPVPGVPITYHYFPGEREARRFAAGHDSSAVVAYLEEPQQLERLECER